MFNDKIGIFLKELRLEKKWSQHKLAEQTNIDVTKINRYENGKRFPTLDDLIIFSTIFNVSLDELLNGQRQKKSKNNSALINYLKLQNTKIKKFKLFSILLIILCIIFFIIIAFLYFFNNYKSIRVYSFFGNSENYKIENGILVLSREKMYFQIGSIKPNVEEIEIYTEKNDIRTLVYKGNTTETIKDYYGYNFFISYSDFIKSKQNIIIVINGEEIKLNFKEDFINDNIINSKIESIGSKNQSINEIPIKIKKYFECNDNFCTLNNKNELIIYNNGIFDVNLEKESYSYDISNSILNYTLLELNETYSLKIDNDKVFCLENSCPDYEVLYDKFYKNYLKKYLF